MPATSTTCASGSSASWNGPVPNGARLAEQAVALDEQAVELRRSNSDLEQFAYVASHDLQEPLRKVASFCQLLEQRYADALDERGVEYIGFAVDGAKRMQVLINDLLTFSRVGRLKSTHQIVDLDTTLDAAARNLAVAIEESGAELVRRNRPLPEVVGDATLLTMLWQNLIGNAIKFRHEDRAPRVEIDCERGVGDTRASGCSRGGLTASASRPSSSTRCLSSSSVCMAETPTPEPVSGWPCARKSLSARRYDRIDASHQHRNSIWFTLPDASPATICARLPKELSDDIGWPPHRRAADRRRSRRHTSSPEKLSSTTRFTTRCMSHTMGRKAWTTSINAALIRSAPRPDLILLDLNLPKDDGRQLLEQIKSDPGLCPIPVVVLTTSAAEEDILRSYRLHANAYVTKPVGFKRIHGSDSSDRPVLGPSGDPPTPLTNLIGAH